MLLQKKFLIIEVLLVLAGLFPVTAQDSLQAFLYYVNKNQAIDFIHFYNADYKIAYGSQKQPGPLPVYLINRHNLICDTLDYKVLPEFILFDKSGSIYICGPDAFHHIRIDNGTFNSVSHLSINDYRHIAKNLWRVIRIEEKMIGLQGSGNRTSVVALTGNQITELVPFRKTIRSIKGQRQLNITYSYAPGALFVFITPYQSLFRISLNDLTVTEIKLPGGASDYVWYYFFDHLKEQHYFVRDEVNRFRLYVLLENRLAELMTLKNFPNAILDEKIHYIIESGEGRGHYLVPVSWNERVNSLKNYFMLNEIQIRVQKE